MVKTHRLSFLWFLDSKPQELRYFNSSAQSLFLLGSIFQRRVGSRQAGDRDTERRAAYIVIADGMAELDGIWITAMLAANTDFQLNTSCTAIVNSRLHQAAHTIAIDSLERILGQDAIGDISTQEVALGIITL
jgi:hypothetical protein